MNRCFDNSIGIHRVMLESGDETFRSHADLAAISAFRGEAVAARQHLQRAFDAGWRGGFLGLKDPRWKKFYEDEEMKTIVEKAQLHNKEMRVKIQDLEKKWDSVSDFSANK